MAGATFGATIGTAASASNPASLSITVPAGGVPAGALVIVGFYKSNQTNSVTAPTDTKGNTYVAIKRIVGGNNNASVEVYASILTTALVSGNTISFSFNGGPRDAAMRADYWTNVSSATADASGSNSSTANVATWTSGSATPTQTDDLVYVLCGFESGNVGSLTTASYTAFSSLPTGNANNGIIAGYLLDATTVTAQSAGGGFTSNGQYGAIIALFKTVASGPTTISVSDSASGTDTPTLATIAPAVSDTATGSDTPSFLATVTIAVADSAAGLDTPALLLQIPIVDAGAGGVEALSFGTAVFTVTDAGTAAEAIALATLSVGVGPDAASGTDAASLGTISPAIPDSGVGGDAPSLGAIAPALTDTATGADAPTLATIAPALTDSGSASEGVVVGQGGATPISVTDSGAGADALALGTIAPAPADSGAGADTPSLATVTPAISETGAAGESVALLVAPAASDAASGVDAVALATITPALSDAASGVDAALSFATVLVPLNDAAAASDAVNVTVGLVSVSVNDTAAAADAPSLPTLSLTLVDAATGALLQTVAVRLPIADSATGAEIIAGITPPDVTAPTPLRASSVDGALVLCYPGEMTGQLTLSRVGTPADALTLISFN